jgi:hypothetical protein
MPGSPLRGLIKGERRFRTADPEEPGIRFVELFFAPERQKVSWASVPPYALGQAASIVPGRNDSSAFL